MILYSALLPAVRHTTERSNMSVSRSNSGRGVGGGLPGTIQQELPTSDCDRPGMYVRTNLTKDYSGTCF